MNIGQLCSSTVNTRQDTITFLQRLSSQCSDTEVCINISQYLLDMLMGKGNCRARRLSIY